MMTSSINWDTPAKNRSTEEHNKTFSSDCSVAGTYVSNMSEQDARSWKGKIKGNKVDGRYVELRKSFRSSNVLIYVSLGAGFKVSKYIGPDETKGVNIRMSTNGPIEMTFGEMTEMNQVIEKATQRLQELDNETRSS